MSRRYFTSNLYEERGVALILSLLIIMVLSVLSASIVVTTLTESKVSAVQRWDAEALFIAEAGLEEVLYRVNLQFPTEVTVNGETFNAAIKDTGSWDTDWMTRIFLCSYPPPAGEGNCEHTATIQSENSWLDYSHPTDENLALSIQHKLNSDGTIATLDSAPINLVTVYGRKGLAKREVLAELSPDRWHPNSALLCEEDMVVSGNPEIGGTVGHVHTNSNMEIPGSPHIHGDASACGVVNISGGPTIDGDIIEGAREQWIPEVRAEDYEFMLDYRLCSDGMILDAGDNPVEVELGWNHTPGKWKVTGNSAADGVYYVEGNVEILGNPGSPEDLWEATIICEGCISVGGSPFMVSGYGGILLVAEGDANHDGVIDAEPVVEVSGTPSQHAANYSGAILSHGDLKIKGNPGVEGCLVCEGGIPIGGSPIILYNGARYKFPYMRYGLAAWRER